MKEAPDVSLCFLCFYRFYISDGFVVRGYETDIDYFLLYLGIRGQSPNKLLQPCPNGVLLLLLSAQHSLLPDHKLFSKLPEFQK